MNKNPQAPQATAQPPKYPARARVRSASGGTFVHLFTNNVIDSNGRTIDIDGFARSQLDAGKWVIDTES